jgi:hypothetical protein
MKVGVRLLGTVSILWTIMTFILIGLMLIPAVPGVVQFELPPPESWTSTIDNNTVTMSNNVSIRNGGLFPFNDLYFVLQLYGANGAVLAQFNSTKADLPTNTWVTIPLQFQVNRSNIEENQLRDMIFDEVTYGGLIYFNIRYLFDFRAQAGFNGNISMGPMIKGNLEFNNTSVVNESGNYILEVPYSFNSSKILYGRNLTLTGTISNDTMELGSWNTSIALGTYTEGNMTLVLNEEAYQHLSTTPDHLLLNVTATAGEFTWYYDLEKDWQPPGGN